MELLQFALLGLGAGAIYGLIAHGLVVVYKGSGVLNFAQGAMVMVGAYAYYQVTVTWSLPPWMGMAFAPVVGALVGCLVQFVVLKRMKRSSPLLRVVATLAILMVLQAGAVLVYGVEVKSVPSFLPSNPITILPNTIIGVDRVYLFAIGTGMTLLLWWLYRSTGFGRSTAAVAENERAAASLGHSPDRIAIANWGTGSGLAALAGAFIAPITFLQPTQLVLLLIPALAVGLIANFSSFPIAFCAAIVLGVLESILDRYIESSGVPQSVPFLAVIAVLVIRGKSVPIRGYITDRFPNVGSGRIPPLGITVSLVIMVVLVVVLPPVWNSALTVTIGYAILCLSIVVTTGYAGQLSLAQFILAGLGALVTARLLTEAAWPFALAILGGMGVTTMVGLLVGAVALKTRGIALAIVTLGLGVVLYNLVLNNTRFNGGALGIRVTELSIFGIDIDSLFSPERYGLFAVAVLFVVAVGTLNIRRGVVGRRMLAVRANERASAALGIGVFGIKLFAFSVGAAIAALAGVVLAFRNFSVIPSQFTTFSSITIVALTVVGGVGLVGGAVMGATLVPGGISSRIFEGIEAIDAWLPLASGLVLLVVLVTEPSGLWAMNARNVKKLAAKLPSRSAGQRSSRPPAAVSLMEHEVAKRTAVPRRAGEHEVALKITGLRVQFGGVVAIDDLDLQICPGKVHGLIGPNGAGKTTVIDAASGFVTASGGTVALGNRSITRWSPVRRARAGLVRSFQAVELFDDLTIRENLAVASDDWTPTRYLLDFVWPRSIRLNDTAVHAARQFGLLEKLDHMPDDLSMGERRLAAIARAVAAGPSVLCLDEPAAGLSDAEADHLASLIVDLAKEWGVAILLVEHNVDMVLRACDEMTVMVQGKVLLSGIPNDVIRDPQVLAAYLGQERDVEQSAHPANQREATKS